MLLILALTLKLTLSRPTEGTEGVQLQLRSTEGKESCSSYACFSAVLCIVVQSKKQDKLLSFGEAAIILAKQAKHKHKQKNKSLLLLSCFAILLLSIARRRLKGLSIRKGAVVRAMWSCVAVLCRSCSGSEPS